MNKNVFGRKLKRDMNERKALFKSLISSLVLSERITTTEAKAKAIRSEIEKLVTKAKKNENGAIRALEKSLSKEAFDKIVKDIAPRFSKRQGGYVRLIKLGKRFGDDAPMVVIEWTEQAEIVVAEAPKEKKKKVVKVKESKAKVVKSKVKKTAKVVKKSK